MRQCLAWKWAHGCNAEVIVAATTCWAQGLLAGIASSTFAEQVPLFMSAKHAFMSANDGLQVPFFVAVERLEQEKRHLLKERETFKRALMRRQVK